MYQVLDNPEFDLTNNVNLSVFLSVSAPKSLPLSSDVKTTLDGRKTVVTRLLGRSIPEFPRLQQLTRELQ